jgi:hypothetical protein
MKALFLSLAACLALAAGCGQHNSAESTFLPITAPLTTIQTGLEELGRTLTSDGHLNDPGKHSTGSALVHRLANVASLDPAE